MKIAVSACLLGENCKYDGGNNLNDNVMKFLEGHEVIPVCPEVLGGLSVPRNPVEIVNGVVQDKDGNSVDDEFRLGARKAVDIILENQVELVVLQPRSPSCGAGKIYDGTFSRTLIPGNGIFAQLLIDSGIKVMTVEELPE